MTTNALVNDRQTRLNCTQFSLFFLNRFVFFCFPSQNMRFLVYQMIRITPGYFCTVNCLAMRLASVRIHHCRQPSRHVGKIERRKMKTPTSVVWRAACGCVHVAHSCVSVCVRTVPSSSVSIRHRHTLHVLCCVQWIEHTRSESMSLCMCVCGPLLIVSSFKFTNHKYRCDESNGRLN